jgi:hypothetical protein
VARAGAAASALHARQQQDTGRRVCAIRQGIFLHQSWSSHWTPKWASVLAHCLARTKMTDVIDAAVALLAKDGDEILTADPSDLRALVKARGAHVEIVQV